jgi:hypothetical protein
MRFGVLAMINPAKYNFYTIEDFKCSPDAKWTNTRADKLTFTFTKEIDD